MENEHQGAADSQIQKRDPFKCAARFEDGARLRPFTGERARGDLAVVCRAFPTVALRCRPSLHSHTESCPWQLPSSEFIALESRLIGRSKTLDDAYLGSDNASRSIVGSRG